jgi:hypothetical protein
MFGRAMLVMALWSAMPLAHGCNPDGWSRAELTELKSTAFDIADSADRDALALDLLDCLGDPDPALRDGIAFEALSLWMRQEKLRTKTLRALHARLLPMLAVSDEPGFRAPFAALVLSEVARTDRIKPWLGAAARERLLTAAAAYIAGVNDYRGFRDGEGWRHGVAHGADLALQLIVNPAVTREQVDVLVAAVLSQVAPSGQFYHFGEPERLARPILFAAGRGLHTPDELQSWIAQITNPAPLSSWGEAFASEQGLAKRHNTMAFLLAAYANADLSSDTHIQALTPFLIEALKQMP